MVEEARRKAYDEALARRCAAGLLHTVAFIESSTWVHICMIAGP